MKKKNIRFNSLFTQIFFSLNLLSFILFVMFFAFTTQTISQSMRENNLAASRHALSSICHSMDQTFLSLQQQMTQLSNEQGILSALISKKEQTLKFSNALNSLAMFKENNVLIKSVLLYIPQQDKLLTSRYEVSALGDSSYKGMINSYLNVKSISGFVGQYGKTTAIKLYEDDIVLIRDFPLPDSARLGVLFFVLQPEELMRLTGWSTDGPQQNLFVYGSKSEPVFSKKLSYPALVTESLIRQVEDSGQNNLQAEDKILYLQTSSLTGWKYIYLLDLSAVHPKLSAIFKIVLPVLFLFLLVALLISFYVTRFIYKPIGRLITEIKKESLADKNEKDSAANELDYIKTVFDNLLNTKTDQDRLLHDIVPEVIHKLFKKLVSGTYLEHGQIQNTLRNMESPFETDDVFVAIACLFPGDAAKEAQEEAVAAIEDLLAQTRRKGNFYSDLQILDHAVCMAILVFKKTQSDFQTKSMVLNLEKLLSGLPPFHEKLAMRHGRIYHSIQDLIFSYEEALEKVWAIQAAASSLPSASSSPEEPESIANPAPLRTGQIFSLLEKENPTGALELAQRVLQQLGKENEDPEKTKRFIEAFADGLLEKLAEVQVATEGVTLHSLRLVSALELSDEENKAQFLQEGETYARMVLGLATEAISRRQNPYVLAAQSCIAAQYADSALSLTALAESIQVNPSYLSRLFKHCTGVHFVDYLNQYRVEKAKALLGNHDLSIKEIASRTGFNSSQSFIRVFKKTTGKTPGQFGPLKKTKK